MYVIHNFLVLHFGGNFIKNRAEIAELQIHENLHKNVNENMYSHFYTNSWVYEGQLKQQICHSQALYC